MYLAFPPANIRPKQQTPKNNSNQNDGGEKQETDTTEETYDDLISRLNELNPLSIYFYVTIQREVLELEKNVFAQILDEFEKQNAKNKSVENGRETGGEKDKENPNKS